jgi:hypothetical protein
VDFQEAERRYAELKRQFDVGTIGVDDFNAVRQRLMVQDDEGRWWAKSPTNDEWVYHDDDSRAWVPGTPPEPIVIEGQPPPSSRREYVENGPQPVPLWMLAGLAVVLIVGIALGWTLVSDLRDGPTPEEQAQLEKRFDRIEAALDEGSKVAQGSNETTTSSTSFVDLPGASVRISVPAREKGLILARFVAESACYNNTDVRQQAPGTPAANDVEDGVEDLAQGVYPRATGTRVGGEVRLKTGPLDIGEVGGVCSSHHAR